MGRSLCTWLLDVLDRFFKALLDFYLKVEDDSTSTYKAEHHHRYVSSGIAKGSHLEF